MQPFANVDEYIAAQAPAAQPRLRELRAIVSSALPGASEYISYGMPAYKRNDLRVYFAAAKRHCALYGTASDLLADELGARRQPKGTVQFPLDEPIPADLVRKLIDVTAEAST
jgi:uncharacterized protein YdhG (YjbR/CyaY superfamily)